MRGIDPQSPRPSSLPARSFAALVFGAAILAGATVSAARGQEAETSGGLDDTAMALPRLPTGSSEGGVPLPRPLSAGEAARVKRILSAQARGDIPWALRETDVLSERRLLGTILADRYLGRHYTTTPAELAAWLAVHGDQPEGPAIQALLRRRLPPGSAMPAVTVSSGLEAPPTGDPIPEDLEPIGHTLSRVPALERAVADRARDGDARGALRMIAAARAISPAYAMALRAEVARAQFARNEDAAALTTAAGASRRAEASDQVAAAGYVAGLAAWRMGHTDLARGYFESSFHAPYANASARAAAAFWVARAQGELGRRAAAATWLRRAAEEPRTFHGQIARRTLGMQVDLARGELGTAREILGEADVAAIAAIPAGWRAFALLQVGEPARAEAELRMIWPMAAGTPGLGRALLLVADRAGMVDFAAQLAALVQIDDGRPHDAQRFAVPRLRPRGGFSVDPALVYALARLESNFDARAVSPVGARGLMQLMPTTAGYIAGDKSLAHGGAQRLHDPALNLDLGQRYVSYLATQEAVAGDLIRLLACYNSGPGSFARWAGGVRDDGDPMLFVEAIPNRETREFVQHVLTYTWIYAARLRLPAPSLDEIARGGWPRFAPRVKEATLSVPVPVLH